MSMRALAVLLLAPCCAALATGTVGAIRPGTTGQRLSPVARLSEEAPVADAVATSGPILSRRCVSLLGPMLLLAPRVARADEDSLVAALRDVRTDFSSEATGVAVLVQTREWDDVRTQIRRALTLLTLKGYLGASVKSRILAMAEGSPERKGLTDARQALLQALGALDRLAFEQQQRRDKAFDPTEGLAIVQASVDALDAVITRLAA
eukprot:scaffold64115_cov65-Phaeocystis_antarctica.AAC.6